ncbi:hypothetical protein GCM10010464_54130 [Pseudonocardia yunnanensis]
MANRATNSTVRALADIPEYPMQRAAGCPFDPSPAQRNLAQEGLVPKIRLCDGSTPWLVTRYHDQRALLADPRISADISHPNFPNQTAGLRSAGIPTEPSSPWTTPSTHGCAAW